MKVKLTRLMSSHPGPRPPPVEGSTAGGLPRVGAPFMVGGRDALFTTSPVRRVGYTDASTVIFSTQNSTYCVELLDDEEM